MPEKRCATCHEVRPWEDFNLQRRSVDGRQDRCRDCCRAWYQRNQVSHKQRVRARKVAMLPVYRQRLAEYFLEHPCVDCGESDLRVLEFDHREGADKLSEVTLLISAIVSWERIMEEIEKCDVRCANCHRRVTAERGGYWRHLWWLKSREEFPDVG